MGTDPNTPPAPAVLALPLGDLIVEVRKGPPIVVVAKIFAEQAVMSAGQWQELAARVARTIALAEKPGPFTPPYEPGVVPRFGGERR